VTRRFEHTPLHSRVARRLFVVFVLCALLPFIATASYALLELGRVADDSDSARLGYTAKSYALELSGNLTLADEAFQAIIAETSALSGDLPDRFGRRAAYTGRVQVFDDERVRRRDIPGLEADRLGAVLSGGAVLLLSPDDAGMRAPRDGAAGLSAWLVRRQERTRTVIMAELSIANLWGAVDDFADRASLAVYLAPATLLTSSSGETPPGLLDAFGATLGRRKTGQDARSLTVVQVAGRDYHARTFDYPLARSFHAPALRVVAWEPMSGAAANLSTRQLVFPALMLAGVLLAAFLAARQLQRQLRPLDRLIVATRRIAARDFDAVVRIESNDEFRELGDAFSGMVTALKREFAAVEAMAEVDRLLLESRGLETVLDALLPRMSRVVDCHSASVTLVDPMSPDRARVFEFVPALGESLPVRRVAFDAEQMRERFARNPVLELQGPQIGELGFISSLADCGARRVRCLPLRQDSTIAGVLSLGFDAEEAELPSPASGSGVDHSRELADRLSVALSNLAHGDALYRQAHFDSLTGLPNRQFFHKRLRVDMESAAVNGSQGALIYIDLDNFKRVNDTAGHASGDELLRVAAQRLGNCCRGEDLVARLGGDEFAIVVRDGSSAVELRQICDRVLTALAAPIRVGKREHLVSASIGITVFGAGDATLEQVLKHADIAMYRAKDSGRNRVVFFEPEMNARIEARVALESGLQRALQEQMFELYYQPIVSAQDWRLAGAEALLRWPGAPANVTGPAQFIGAAEQTGLIVGIGEWALNRACSQLRDWRARGLALPYVSVNVSPRQLAEPRFAEMLRHTLERCGTQPRDLLVEITEGVFAEGEAARAALADLAQLGVRLAIDDFGTGYSSLGYLRTFPIDAVKIDRSFITDIPGNESAEKLVETIIHMGQGLNKVVIAEGVETPEQARFLRKAGCDSLQGYHISRPMPADAFGAWMESYRIAPAQAAARDAG
jgi:diguanylate cyclase (GGDEF)-like protein